jgi:hypothetical protein
MAPAYAGEPEVLKLRRHLFEPVEVTLDQIKTAQEVSRHCEAVHAARVGTYVTTKHRGEVTLAGVRGVAVADLLDRLGADSQRAEEVSRLFLPDPGIRLAG